MIAHVSSDLIAAYNPAAVGDLIGDKNNSSVFDNSKIKRFVPDFNCEVTWAEGVRRSLAWFDGRPRPPDHRRRHEPHLGYHPRRLRARLPGLEEYHHAPLREREARDTEVTEKILFVSVCQTKSGK